MTDPRRGLLVQHLSDFVSGKDRSKEFVGKIEGILLQYFRDSELYEELCVAVASYQPGGGEFVYDEEELARVFQYALKRLSGEESQSRPAPE